MSRRRSPVVQAGLMAVRDRVAQIGVNREPKHNGFGRTKIDRFVIRRRNRFLRNSAVGALASGSARLH